MGDVEIEKKKFRYSKKAIDVNKIDIKKSLVSGEFAYDENKEKDAEYLIGYKTGKKIRPLPATLPQTSEYPSKVGKPSACLWINLERIRNIIGKRFDKQPVLFC